MFTHFKRFLRDAKLIDGNKCTNFSSLICDLGWETDTALGLMLVNLAYENAQFDWYITQMDTGYYYESSIIKERLLAEDMKEKAANSVVKSFKRIATTPFGTVLNFCYVTDDDDMVRTKCSIPENWKWVRLEDIAYLTSGSQYEEVSDGIPYVKVADMNTDVNIHEIVTSSRFVSSENNSMIPKASIIFPKRGGAISTNKKRLVLKTEIFVDSNIMAMTMIYPPILSFIKHWC